MALRRKHVNVSEDCLICDIYVPGHPSDQNNKAVIIWFMGGEFQTGQTGLLPATDVTLELRSPQELFLKDLHRTILC
jgi:carboxylesterase type B